MSRPYSLAHLTVLGCAPPQVIEIAARCGYDCVGLRTIPLGLAGEPRYGFDDNRPLFRDTARALKDTGLTLLDIEVAVLGEDRAVSNYAQALEDAAELGAKHVLCNAWSGDRALIQTQFDALCDLAAPYGLSVECEFVTFTRIPHLTDALDIVQASGRSNAGVLIDTLHFGRSKVDLSDLETLPDDKVHYLQLGDGAAIENPTDEQLKATARGERLYPGEGPTPIREIVSRYPGRPVAIEVIHARRVEELGYEGFARACLDNTRRCLGDA